MQGQLKLEHVLGPQRNVQQHSLPDPLGVYNAKQINEKLIKHLVKETSKKFHSFTCVAKFRTIRQLYWEAEKFHPQRPNL